MMEKREMLINGEKYPLKVFFSGINDKIIIPDLQRDYCWGDSPLVKNFVESLLALDREQPITLGLIYGYVDTSLIAEHLQLCDGQQRLTTIFLLLGLLYRATGDTEIRKHLISEFELHDDDREPYLLYAIRESSVYFLADLTYYYYLGNGEIDRAKEIRNQPWYLESYDHDPSIASMIKALAAMEEIIGSYSGDLNGFASFLLDKVEFLYVDMNNRRDGEETFVVINTTGEPLTTNENLKPKVIRANRHITDAALRWEDMEQWFWVNRNRSAKPEHTADEGFSQFVKVLRLMQSRSDGDYISIRDNMDKIPVEEIPFEIIWDTFLAYKRLYSLADKFEKRYDEAPDYAKGYTENTLFTLLPAVRYIMRFPESCDEDVLRVFHIFRNNARYRNTDVNRADNIAPAYRAMANIEAMPTAAPEDVFKSTYMPTEEKDKFFQLLRWMADGNSAECDPIEQIMARAESHPIFRGRISLLLDWAGGDLASFERYLTRFEALWPSFCGHELDTLRRVLLSKNLSGYPMKYPGKGIHTFCNEAEHWYTLIHKNENTAVIKQLLDDERPLEEMIEENSGKFKALIEHPEWWKRMERANVLLYDDNLYVLLRKERTSSDYWLIYHGESFGMKYLGAGWAWMWKHADNSGLYADFQKYDVTIDIKQSATGFRLILSEGKHKDKPLLPKLHEIALSFGMSFTGGYVIERPTVAEIKKLAKEVAETISNSME